MRALLVEILAKAKGRLLKVIEESYQAVDKIVFAYIEQMEEF